MFVLVKYKKIFCLFVIGEMDILFNELILVFDINKNVDMVILFGMLMVLNKFVIVIWYCNFLLKNSGVFVVLNFNLMFLFFYSLW